MQPAYRRQKRFGLASVLAGLLVLTTIVPMVVSASTDNFVVGGISLERRYPATCRDPIGCELPAHLTAMANFLSMRKEGLFTPDPRPLTPAAEVVRLNVVPQALGYLNLYRSTKNVSYRREGEDRLRYLLQIGPSGYGADVRMGMIGYAFAIGYETTGNAQYKQEAIRIADACVQQPPRDAVMNGGLMCGFHLATMYRLTGTSVYRDTARKIIERTSVWQDVGGAFPHQQRLNELNTSYTAWMVTELLLIRQSDPGYDLNDLLLSKAMSFLERRVNLDGSINYQDEQGVYYLDSDNLDSRYWTGEVANIALNMAASGRRDVANRALRFLFSTELTGFERGSYPDKYNLTAGATIWETGRPSIIRTSLIFWYLSMISSLSDVCANGPTTNCTITSQSCSSLYQSLSLCNQGIPGVRSCLSGSYTSCLNIATTTFSPSLVCQVDSYCQDDPQWGACYYDCYRSGHQLCVQGVCAGICYAVQEGEVQCDSSCYAGERCSSTPIQRQQ